MSTSEKMFVVINDDGLAMATNMNPFCQYYDLRRRKMLQWAYGDCHVDAATSLVYKIDRYWSQGSYVERSREVAKNQPLVIENVPVGGLRLGNVVKRRSTDNKWCRIIDPRGFTLEISVEHLYEILNDGVMIEGVLIGSYVWDFGKNGIGKPKLVKVNNDYDDESSVAYGKMFANYKKPYEYYVHDKED